MKGKVKGKERKMEVETPQTTTLTKKPATPLTVLWKKSFHRSLLITMETVVAYFSWSVLEEAVSKTCILAKDDAAHIAAVWVIGVVAPALVALTGLRPVRRLALLFPAHIHHALRVASVAVTPLAMINATEADAASASLSAALSWMAFFIGARSRSARSCD